MSWGFYWFVFLMVAWTGIALVEVARPLARIAKVLEERWAFEERLRQEHAQIIGRPR